MKKLLIFMFFVLFILFSGFVLAEGPPGVSDVGVEYDSELDGQFLLNEWVHVTVDVKDFSNVTINYKEDSVEVQAMKDNLRWDVYRNTSEAVLSTLSEDEFQIWRKSEWGTFFSGNITREGFDKLLNDKRVRKIYAKKEFYATLDESAPLINADYAWTSGYDGTGQTVCIIDTGVNFSHPDLGGCFGSGCKVLGGYDFVNGDSNPMDDNGHGTHVAGIVASEDGIYGGVAPWANIVALKAGNENGHFSDGGVISSLQWCYAYRNVYNISVVSMSFGGSNGWGQCSEDFANEEINDLYNAGITLVAASGNDGDEDQIAYPACNDQVISVGAVYDDNVGSVTACTIKFFGWCLAECTDATTSADMLACWSNRGNLLDVLAPGCEVTSTNLSGNFVTKCGTSMSAPMVAGAAALLYQKSPYLEPSQIQYILQSTGVDVYDPESDLTFKRIDVEAALNSLCTTGDWQAGSCGGGTCGGDERYYTRTTEPDGCATETKCEYDSSCDQQGGGTPTGISACDYEDEQDEDCPSGYSAVDHDCYWDGGNWECETNGNYINTVNPSLLR